MRKLLVLAGVLLITLTLALALSGTTWAQETLHKRLGGSSGINNLVSDFITATSRDSRLGRYLARMNQAHSPKLLAEYFCAVTGGGCTYTGRSMKEAHRGLGINDAEWAALVGDLGQSLDKNGAGSREKTEVLQTFDAMRVDIVEVKAANPPPAAGGLLPTALPATGGLPLALVVGGLGAGLALVWLGLGLRRRRAL